MFSDKTALVTGGSGGIGRAIAHALARRGAKVIVTARDASHVNGLAREIGGDVAALDLSDRAATLAFVEALPAIDLLVNNAGIAESAPLSRTTDDMWDRAMAVNVTGPFLLTRAVLPAMMKRGFGRVVNIASNAGLVGYAYTSAYVASKHALVGLTRALAKEVGASGVTVNAICPGFVDTPMTAHSVENISRKTGRSAEESQAALAALSPQKRLITPDEVAELVVYLASDAARGVSGAAIALDGGQTA